VPGHLADITVREYQGRVEQFKKSLRNLTATESINRAGRQRNFALALMSVSGGNLVHRPSSAPWPLDWIASREARLPK
jgi:hypothetical protein